MDPHFEMIGFGLTTLGMLGGGLWKLSALATRIELAVGNLQKQIDAFEADRGKIEMIPLLKQRIEQLEALIGLGRRRAEDA